MKKIKIEDILDLTAYEKIRREFRPKIMAIKDKRRIYVGPKATYLFENYDTMWYQVQEMTRAERIVDDEGIQGELNAYNELIPGKNQLSASLLIEISDIGERKDFLCKIVDLPNHTYLSIEGERIKCEFDPRQGSEDKLSSVQYVKFNLTDGQVKKFKETEAEIVLGFDHPEYSYEQVLTIEQKKILYQDLIAD
jgi:hypothetical protein